LNHSLYMRHVQTQNDVWNQHQHQVHPQSASSFRFGLAIGDLRKQTPTQSQSQCQSQQPDIGIDAGTIQRTPSPFFSDQHLPASSSGSGSGFRSSVSDSTSASLTACGGSSYRDRDTQNRFGRKPLLRSSSKVEEEWDREPEHELSGDQDRKRSRSGTDTGSILQQLHHLDAYPPPSLISRSKSVESITSVSSSSTSAAPATSRSSSTSFSVAATKQQQPQPQQFVFTTDQDMYIQPRSPHLLQQPRHALYPITPFIHASIASEFTESSSFSGSASASGPHKPSSTGGCYNSHARSDVGISPDSSEHRQQSQGYTPLPPLNEYDYILSHLQTYPGPEGYHYDFDYLVECGMGSIPNETLVIGGAGFVEVGPNADASVADGKGGGADNAGTEGSLDPTTGVYCCTSEQPRMRTSQACEKCRVRKAKVRNALPRVFFFCFEKTLLHFLPLLHLCRFLSALSSLFYFVLLAFVRSFSYPSDTSFHQYSAQANAPRAAAVVSEVSSASTRPPDGREEGRSRRAKGVHARVRV
jgi:hypothetical protein